MAEKTQDVKMKAVDKEKEEDGPRLQLLPLSDSHVNDIDLIKNVARVVAQIRDLQTAPMPLEGTPLFHFAGKQKPTMPIDAYIMRCLKAGTASQEALLCAMLYLDRLLRYMPIDGYSIHRFMGMAIMMASKFYDDFFYDNKSWAFVLGVPLAEINRMELDFLFLFNCDLHISRVDYVACAKMLMNDDQFQALGESLA